MEVEDVIQQQAGAAGGSVIFCKHLNTPIMECYYTADCVVLGEVGKLVAEERPADREPRNFVFDMDTCQF